MNEKDKTAASKKLSWLLRHGAAESHLAMDAAGWAAVDDVLRTLKMPRAVFDEAVESNTKKRFEVEGDRVRACQGHSIENAPVDLDALEASWEKIEVADESQDIQCMHGTGPAAIDGIARDGIVSVARTHVHLAASVDATVGKRAGVDLMLVTTVLTLKRAGVSVFRSPNGVLLARSVPRECITDVIAVTSTGRSALAKVKEKLRLS